MRPSNLEINLQEEIGVKKYFNYIISLVISIVAISLALFHLYTAGAGPLTAQMQRSVHLSGALMLMFLAYFEKTKERTRVGDIVNLFLVLLTMLIGIYYIVIASPGKMVDRMITGPTTLDIIVGLNLILLLLEATRRFSKSLAVVGSFFLLYLYFGPYMPQFLAHQGYNISNIVYKTAFSPTGIFGFPLGVSATYVALFVLFGTFLQESGAGGFFVNIAYALAGRKRSGPALTGVIASCMMGSISGSAVANVVTTGTFTIPLMKRIGYKPHFAAAIESVASSGGQLMPPVMGAVAFIMAEFLGISYVNVVRAAILPAILFYLSVAVMVHLQANKAGLKPLSSDEIPVLSEVFCEGWYHILPLMVLIYFMFIVAYTPVKSALIAICSIILINQIVGIFNPQQRLGLNDFIKAVVKGAKNLVTVAIACAVAGIAVSTITSTGVGLKLTYLVLEMSGGNLLPVLIITAVACLILGMGLPTSAAYVITVSVAAQALIKLDIDPIVAHFFVLYFSVISLITPPVAIAAYAAASIANADAFRTGFTATRLGIVAYIVPFMFVYGPSLLMIGTTEQIISSFITAVIGVIALGGAVQAWFFTKMSLLERIIALVGSLALIKPGFESDLAGLILVIIVLTAQIIKRRTEKRKKKSW